MISVALPPITKSKSDKTFNCDVKPNSTDWSHPTAYRGCREPMTHAIEDEFDGDKAKLEWPVSTVAAVCQSCQSAVPHLTL